MLELLCGVALGVFITLWDKAGFVAMRDEFSIGREDKTDALAKSLGKKVETVPRHYEVKDAPTKE